MHRTGTKHIVHHMQKSVVQWSVISKFTCISLIHFENIWYEEKWYKKLFFYVLTVEQIDFLTPLEDQLVKEVGGSATFECVITKEDAKATWYKEDTAIVADDSKYVITQEAGTHKLTILDVHGEDVTNYTIKIKSAKSTAKLLLEGEFAWSSTWPVSSGPVILIKITLEWSINFQNIWRRGVDRELIDNSPSNIFWGCDLLERYHHNSHVGLAAIVIIPSVTFNFILTFKSHQIWYQTIFNHM